VFKKLRYRPAHDERGQVVLIVAGGLVVLLLFAGLVIDTGVGFRERRASQNISDLSAMAGTRIIAESYLDPSTPVDGSDVYAAVEESAAANGCEDPCTWSAEYVMPNGTGVTTDLGPVIDGGGIPAGAQGVTVTSDRHPATFFMRLIGQDHINVSSDATALTSQQEPPPAGILLPIGIFDADYETGVEYTLTEGEHGPGNFGWLTWFGSPDAGTMADSVCMPDNPAFGFPHWFDGGTGVMNKSQARACLDDYIANETVVYVPIWRQTNGHPGSNLQYEIIGAAAFVLDSYDQHAISVTGHFVEFWSYPGVPAGYGAPPCNTTTDPDCLSRWNFIGLVD
jgi:hypothetical protein